MTADSQVLGKPTRSGNGEEAYLRRERRTRWVRRAFTAFALLFLTGWAIFSLFNVYWMITSSLVRIEGSFSMNDVQMIPRNPSLTNYERFFRTTSSTFWLWVINSIVVTSVPLISNLVFDTLAGYVLAKMRFPGRDTIFWAIIATMMIPGFVTLIPLYKMMYQFKWINTYWALIFPGIAGVGGIFLIKQFLQTLPSSLFDAARMDAASEIGIFKDVALPLAKPVIAVLGIFWFVGGWNDYFWPFLVSRSKEMFTLQVGIISFMGIETASGLGTDFGIMLAAAVIASVPIIIVFLALQQYFMQGVTIGAMKG